nr:MAG TPA: hypothetical protein [Caudoviricetes sp.]
MLSFILLMYLFLFECKDSAISRHYKIKHCFLCFFC